MINCRNCGDICNCDSPPDKPERCNGCFEKDTRIKELEGYMAEIIKIQPLNVFGPMSDRMRRIAWEALPQTDKESK